MKPEKQRGEHRDELKSAFAGQQQHSVSASSSSHCRSPSTALSHAHAALQVAMANKPKRPLSAYNIFFYLERQRILGEVGTDKGDSRSRCHGKIGFAGLARAIASKWKTVDPAEKERFEGLAHSYKAQYVREAMEWKQTIEKIESDLRMEQGMAKSETAGPWGCDRTDGDLSSDLSTNTRISSHWEYLPLDGDFKQTPSQELYQPNEKEYVSLVAATAQGMHGSRGVLLHHAELCNTCSYQNSSQVTFSKQREIDGMVCDRQPSSAFAHPEYFGDELDCFFVDGDFALGEVPNPAKQPNENTAAKNNRRVTMKDGQANNSLTHKEMVPHGLQRQQKDGLVLPSSNVCHNGSQMDGDKAMSSGNSQNDAGLAELMGREEGCLNEFLDAFS